MTYSTRHFTQTATLTVAATFALSTLTACGGGGGGGSGGGPSPSTDPTYDIPSLVAEAAARSVPVFGSVTQSSNAIDEVTHDTAELVHADDGSLILRVTRDNRAPLEISSGGDGTILLAISTEYPALVPGDVLQTVLFRDGAAQTFAYMLTTRQASLALAPGAAPFREGDTIDLSRHGQQYTDFGRYGGDWRAGRSYQVDNDDGVGAYCVSDTESCIADEGGVVTEGTLYLRVGGQAAIVESWDATDNDYLTFGIWLRPQSGSSLPEVGLFADGGRPFPVSELAALSGTATYTGIAIAYALGNSTHADAAPFLLPSTEGEHHPQLEGAVELTADFGALTVDGTVRLFGDPDNYDTPGEPEEPGPIVLNLTSAPIDATVPGGNFTGDTASDGTSSVSGLSGQWGGQFFGAQGSGGRPPHASGTFGAQRPGFAVVGGFMARDGADLRDFLPEPRRRHHRHRHLNRWKRLGKIGTTKGFGLRSQQNK